MQQEKGYSEISDEIQALLEKMDFLDPFQSRFQTGFGIKTALVALYGDLCQQGDRENVSLLIFLDLSLAFSTIKHGILLE